jgi:EAL domain-containing protein (putative c-di-GMP-specific phosphodiesterase class I)
MVYQPKISLADGKLQRVEALVRWDDPTFGAVAPSRFVPLAERHGLIDPLTQWGLRTTLRQWLKWCDKGRDTHIAFNISALSLQHLDFPDLVERMCRALEVPTDRLVLELTEGATQPLVKLMDTLTRFRIKGIGLALDDFGTGFSSMMQLRQLPFTEVKIDRFFVRDMTTSNDSLLIVKSTIDLAHGLGMVATAEGSRPKSRLDCCANSVATSAKVIGSRSRWSRMPWIPGNWNSRIAGPRRLPSTNRKNRRRQAADQSRSNLTPCANGRSSP